MQNIGIVIACQTASLVTALHLRATVSEMESGTNDLFVKELFESRAT